MNKENKKLTRRDFLKQSALYLAAGVFWRSFETPNEQIDWILPNLPPFTELPKKLPPQVNLIHQSKTDGKSFPKLVVLPKKNVITLRGFGANIETKNRSLVQTLPKYVDKDCRNRVYSVLNVSDEAIIIKLNGGSNTIDECESKYWNPESLAQFRNYEVREQIINLTETDTGWSDVVTAIWDGNYWHTQQTIYIAQKNLPGWKISNHKMYCGK